VQQRRKSSRAMFLVLTLFVFAPSMQVNATPNKAAGVIASISGNSLSIAVESDGTYSLRSAGLAAPILRSGVEADIDSNVVRSTDYPQHQIAQSEFKDEFGAGSTLTVTHKGLAGRPDLVCVFRVYKDLGWAESEVKVANSTSHTVSVRAIRTVHAEGGLVVNLGGAVSSDRILSDSYSEDRPQLAIRDIGTAPGGLHRAVGTQLIYNKQSGQSLFIGALTSDKLLTIFHLKEQSAEGKPTIASYEVVATGTTEIMRGESLHESPAAEQVDLSLPLSPGDSLSSERLMVSVGNNYHEQLEEYGRVIARLHKARVNAPTPIGWWSWTAYYFGLSQATATTNIEWLAAHLQSLGYRYFHIDEGYQYARGEYATPDVRLFPLGLKYVSAEARSHGLTFGVWTAPFEVSERAEVYQHHKDWLLHNSAGDLIHIGYVTDAKDPLYVLDVTNPGAQNYLRQTYKTLRDWGVRFIKMDFMDDSAVEGAYYRPHTTALEAQRIGLTIIREAVGEDVVLDKDGSPMLNPVGLVEAGRISQDTGHSFEESKDAASGIAARYYMNRNFFIADPDAFSVSSQTTDDSGWNTARKAITLDEAKVSIALSAISGGMFEIGDDLPTLGTSPERLALVMNPDLLAMAQLGRASIPIDLMNYASVDEQPSEFLLKETPRQTVLTVFNWTNEERTRSVPITGAGLLADHTYEIADVLGNRNCCTLFAGSINFKQAPHSVVVLKLIDGAVVATAPQLTVHAQEAGRSGESHSFSAEAASDSWPVLDCTWEFGDGVSADGMNANHTYTHPGTYEGKATSKGVDGLTFSKTFKVTISGTVETHFAPEEKRRPE